MQNSQERFSPYGIFFSKVVNNESKQSRLLKISQISSEEERGLFDDQEMGFGTDGSYLDVYSVIAVSQC